MYSNYSQIPANVNYYPTSFSSNRDYISSMPGSISSNSDNRIVGGFLGPFVLGGITGGLLAPAFYPRPYYSRPYYPYPYYGPYYR